MSGFWAARSMSKGNLVFVAKEKEGIRRRDRVDDERLKCDDWIADDWILHQTAVMMGIELKPGEGPIFIETRRAGK